MADTETPKPKPLTDQQRRFADFILQGKNQRDAYRLAGYKCATEEVADANASRLISNAKVAEYLEAKRSKVAAKVELTTEHFARRLERIASAAERAALPKPDDEPTTEVLDVSAKEAADIARTHSMDAAKLLGLVIDKSESKVTLHEDRIDRIREKLNGRRSEQPAIN